MMAALDPRRAGAILIDWGRAARDLAYAAASKLRRTAAGQAIAGQCSPIPLVILPGVLEPWRYLLPLGTWLEAQGHPVHYVERLGFNTRDLASSANHVVELLSARNLTGAVFVAHSKGGLIGKLALTHPGIGESALGMVSVATPFGGSQLGGPLQRLPFVDRSSFGMFLAGSQPLTSLSRHAEVNRRIVSMSPAWDQVVSVESTQLAGAEHVRLDVGGHFAPMRSHVAWETIHAHVHQLTERINIPETDPEL